MSADQKVAAVNIEGALVQLGLLRCRCNALRAVVAGIFVAAAEAGAVELNWDTVLNGALEHVSAAPETGDAEMRALTRSEIVTIVSEARGALAVDEGGKTNTVVH
jgi:hypothetical protein